VTFVSLSTARFTTGQLDCWATTRAPARLPPVIYGHGAGGNATELAGALGLTAVPPFVQALTRIGFTVVAATFTNTWGNATTLARLGDALGYARTNLGAHPTAAPIIFGISHGACLLRWHQANSARAALLALPAIDWEALRTADTLGLQDDISIAHGVTYPTPLPAGVNPAQNTASYTNLPMRIYYSTNDDVSVNVAAFASATGATLISLGALGHTNTAVAAIPVTDVVAFIASYA
jgi:hypothetical protein